LIVVYLCWAV